jgi:HEAT repeat protein
VGGVLTALLVPGVWDGDTRLAAIESLGKLKDPRGAEAIVSRMSDGWDGTKAKEALIALGPAAESAVRARLKDSNTFVKQDACKLLASIGTKDSLPALAEAAKGGNHFVKQEANAAIAAITLREKPQ